MQTVCARQLNGCAGNFSHGFGIICDPNNFLRGTPTTKRRHARERSAAMRIAQRAGRTNGLRPSTFESTTMPSPRKTAHIALGRVERDNLRLRLSIAEASARFTEMGNSCLKMNRSTREILSPATSLLTRNGRSTSILVVPSYREG